MAKPYEFNWQKPVPSFMQDGAVFDRYEEVRGQLLFSFKYVDVTEYLTLCFHGAQINFQITPPEELFGEEIPTRFIAIQIFAFKRKNF